MTSEPTSQRVRQVGYTIFMIVTMFLFSGYSREHDHNSHPLYWPNSPTVRISAQAFVDDFDTTGLGLLTTADWQRVVIAAASQWTVHSGAEFHIIWGGRQR